MRFALLLLVPFALVLAAPAQTTISGRVIDRDTGAPVRGQRVDLRTRHNIDPTPVIEAWTDADGRYRLEDVPEGRWRVRVAFAASAATEHLLATPVVRVERGRPLRFDFEVVTTEAPRERMGSGVRFHPSEAPQPGPFAIEGQVLSNPYEFPVDSAVVRLLLPEEAVAGGRRYRTAVWAVADADGRFRLDGVRSDTSYHLLVTHPTHDTLRNVTHRFEAPGELTLFLAKPGHRHLSDPRAGFGRVLDGRGRLMAGALRASMLQTLGTLSGRLFVGDASAAGATVRLIETDAQATAETDGWYQIARLEPGTYTIEVRHGGTTATLPGVAVAAGPNTIDVNLEDE